MLQDVTHGIRICAEKAKGMMQRIAEQNVELPVPTTRFYVDAYHELDGGTTAQRVAFLAALTSEQKLAFYAVVDAEEARQAP